MKRAIHLCLLAGTTVILAACQPQNSQPVVMKTAPQTPTPPAEKIQKSEADWRKQLTPEQYHVLREAGTERPFGETYEQFKKQGGGTYYCAGCGAELFSSKHKFDSHCGWPSFYDPANARNVVTREDHTAGMTRVEVRCAGCFGHLGHVFKGEGFKTPTDLRYCINGVALKFVPFDAGGGAPAKKP